MNKSMLLVVVAVVMCGCSTVPAVHVRQASSSHGNYIADPSKEVAPQQSRLRPFSHGGEN
jgi:uncharacterized protein YceK